MVALSRRSGIVPSMSAVIAMAGSGWGYAMEAVDEPWPDFGTKATALGRNSAGARPRGWRGIRHQERPADLSRERDRDLYHAKILGCSLYVLLACPVCHHEWRGDDPDPDEPAISAQDS